LPSALFDASSVSCSKAVLSAAVTIGRSFLPTQASALRMKWTRQRWTVAPSTLAAAAFSPLVVIRDDQAGSAQAAIGEGAQELVPEDLGFTGLDGNAQRTSRRPSRLTATATMAATLTIRPPRDAP
jgi:hypothetical protein